MVKGLVVEINILSDDHLLLINYENININNITNNILSSGKT